MKKGAQKNNLLYAVLLRVISFGEAIETLRAVRNGDHRIIKRLYERREKNNK